MRRRNLWIIALLVSLAFLGLSSVGMAADSATYGGTLRWREINDPPKGDPAMATDTVSSRMILCIFDTLVENDPDGKGLIPGLAESWEGNEDGTIFTFHLRKGVRFQKEHMGQPTENKGRVVKAGDWKYSFERLVHVTSPRAYFLDMIKGYQDFVDGKATEWSGIKVIDDYTLQF